MDGSSSGARAIDETRRYRRALGCFATGVTAIVTERDGKPVGLTVNSFTSVSLTPRLVLWCLDDRSDRFTTFANAEAWSVNVLPVEQEALSSRLAAGSGEIAPGEIGASGADAPWLTNALARFACRTHARHVMGDHLVIVGEVQAYEADAGDALTYFRGRYGRAHSPAD